MEKDPRSTKASPRPEYKDERDYDDEAETGPFLGRPGAPLPRKPMDRSLRRTLLIIGVVFVAGWCAALGVFVMGGKHRHASDLDHDPDADSRGSGKAVTMDQVFGGFWWAKSHSISWIADPDGQDGLLLEQGAAGKDFLIVEDVRANKDPAAAASRDADTKLAKSRTLMKNGFFEWKGKPREPDWLEPSPNLEHVLLAVNKERNWRHSFTATYFILDVASNTVEPLVKDDDQAKVQLASWSPQSDAVSFTMDNNLYIRRVQSGDDAVQITKDGGPEYFYGIPDWVYEEEVFSWTQWQRGGQRTASTLAFLRTNETGRARNTPSSSSSRDLAATDPAEGEESYPEVRKDQVSQSRARTTLS